MHKRSILAALLGAAFALAQSAGGVKWTAPASWGSKGPSPMRAANYEVPPAPGDKEAGECVVFYFGPGQGGGVQANLDRWISQFQPADGKPKTAKQTINGLSVSTVDVSGTYLSGPPMGQKTPKPGYRMIAAVVEGKQANLFFRFTAPAKTAAAREAEFQALLKSVKPE
jgi:hypothetical protein